MHLGPPWPYWVCSYCCLDLDTFGGGRGAYWGLTSKYTPRPVNKMLNQAMNRGTGKKARVSRCVEEQGGGPKKG